MLPETPTVLHAHRMSSWGAGVGMGKGRQHKR